MKTIADLVEFVKQGNRPAITFQAMVEDLESYAEKGMRARITDMQLKNDDTVRVFVDYREFDEFNKTFESSSYYDKNGNPTLTAREAGYYNPEDSFYVMATDAVDAYFSVESDASGALFEVFKRSGASVSYVQWLESHLLRMARIELTPAQSAEQQLEVIANALATTAAAP